MKSKRKLILLSIISVIVITVAVGIIFGNPWWSDYDFEIHYIDVGQADAALVICDGEAMLIDGGNVNDSGLIYTYLKDRKIDHLKYVIATHAHEDHIGGLAGALNYATVDTIYCPVTSYGSKVFSDFLKYVERRNAKISVPSVGDKFTLGSAEITILGVNSSDDTNDSSIILRITYGKTSFLFTGDAEREAENAVIRSGVDIESTVLKVGHHGSDSSTSYVFLREVMPKYAVISVCADNDYGHPTEAVLSRLRDADVTVYRTDMQGTIICSSNGKEVKFEVYKNKNADTLGAVTKDDYIQPEQVEIGLPETDMPETSFLETYPLETSIADSPTYILNVNPQSLRFHKPTCSGAKQIKEENRKEFYGTREEAIELGYTPCGTCKP